MNNFISKSSVLVLMMSLTACAVGPDFKRPAAPTVKNYTKPAMKKTIIAGKSDRTQHLEMGKKVSKEWWALFHSREINDLVAMSLENNQTLAASVATLAAAQEGIRIAAGALYPQIDANAGMQRRNRIGSSFNTNTDTTVVGGPGVISGSSSNSVSNLFTVGGTVSYLIDIFGQTRRTIEQQTALAENQFYQLGAAYLTITGNAVTLSITAATLRAQLAAVKYIIESDEKNVRLVRLKMEAGKVARIDLLTAESQLANDRTLLPPLRQQLSVTEHALSVLVGKAPGEWSPPTVALRNLKLPRNLPVSLPSELVHQRPDILAAEAQLHAASAAIGIATAQMYPAITISGSGTFQSGVANNLFSRSNLLWSVASGLTTPVFAGGTLVAQRRQAIDNFKASAATYQQTVLTAFGQVADALRALKNDADLVKSQKYAMDVAKQSYVLQQISYAAGKSDLLFLLNASRSYQLALRGYVEAEGQRLQDTAQLFLAMGGGWPSA